MMSSEAVKIVLVEDDDGHAALVEKNLRRAGLANEVLRLKDGQEAIEHFSNGRQGCEPDGCLVLLDIKMPRADGIEVLKRLKQNPATASLPVIMLTTTDDPREIDRCYALGCNVYITKPVEYEAFVEAVRRLGMFLQVVKLPPITGNTPPAAGANG
jgi:CheY-like chemotaxis protein